MSGGLIDIDMKNCYRLMKARSGNDVVEIKLSMFHRSPGRDCERDRNKAHDADY